MGAERDPRPAPRVAHRDYHTVVCKSGARIWWPGGDFGGIVGRLAGCGCLAIPGAIVAGNAIELEDVRCGEARSPCAGQVDFGARAGARRGGLFRRAQCGTARGRRSARRAGAGARRRRDRQDARAHHAHCPYPVLGAGARLADPRRHLHQQGRAGDEGPHRRAGRRRGRRHAVARHLPRHRRQDPAPPQRAGGPEIRLHDPRRRRSAAPRQAGDRERRSRQGPLAGAPSRRPHRPLEEPRPDARPGAARRGVRLCRGPGREALCRLPAAPQGAERGGLRRPAAGGAAPVPRERGRAGRLPAEVALHPGGRVPGYQRRPVSVAAAAGERHPEHLLRGGRRPVHLRLARRRGRQHPALRRGLPGRDRDPAAAELSLDRAYPRGGFGPHRPQQGPARQDAFHGRRPGRARQGRGVLERRRGGALDRRRHRSPAQGRPQPRRDCHPGAGFLPDARLRGSLRHARPPLPGRRRPALLRAPGDQGRHRLPRSHPQPGQRPEVRAHPQRAEARAGRHHPATHQRTGARARRHPALSGRARDRGDRGADRQGPQVALRPHRLLRAVARCRRGHAAHRAGRAGAGRVRLYPDVAAGSQPAGPGPAGEPERADPLHARVRDAAGLPGARRPGDGRRHGRRRGSHRADDAARRQGPGIRGRVPARLGGGVVPPSAQPGRRRQRGPGGGAAAGLRRPDPREADGQGELRPEPAQSRLVADRRAVALRRRAARGARRRGGVREPVWRRRRGRLQPLRPQPLR